MHLYPNLLLHPLGRSAKAVHCQIGSH